MEIRVRFYEELNDYLPPQNRKKDFELRINAGCSLKQLLESCGLPCAKVDLILVNSVPETLGYTLKDGDRISVYPVFERMDISSLNRLRNTPLRRLKFICDVHLGKLAKYLRMLGFDTLYENDYTRSRILELSGRQERIILTRNQRLLQNKKVSRGFLIRQEDPWLQAKAVVAAFDLRNTASPLSRCLECNGLIVKIPGDAVQDRIEAGLLTRYDVFFECDKCKKIYWKGSHRDSMVKLMEKLLAE